MGKCRYLGPWHKRTRLKRTTFLWDRYQECSGQPQPSCLVTSQPLALVQWPIPSLAVGKSIPSPQKTSSKKSRHARPVSDGGIETAHFQLLTGNRCAGARQKVPHLQGGPHRRRHHPRNHRRPRGQHHHGARERLRRQPHAGHGGPRLWRPRARPGRAGRHGQQPAAPRRPDPRHPGRRRGRRQPRQPWHVLLHPVQPGLHLGDPRARAPRRHAHGRAQGHRAARAPRGGARRDRW